MDPRFRGGDIDIGIQMFAKKTRKYDIALQTSDFEVCGVFLAHMEKQPTWKTQVRVTPATVLRSRGEGKTLAVATTDCYAIASEGRFG
ncbi:MAG: hypothetical protein ACRD1N_04210 [Terriglobia bacterium]